MVIYSVWAGFKSFCGFFPFYKVILELAVEAEITVDEEGSERQKD